MKIYIILSVSLTLFIQCTQQDENQRDCIETMLTINEMVPYTGDGSDLGCESWLELFDVKGQQIYVLQNNCIDMLYDPRNCDNISICNDAQSIPCLDFYAHGVSQGIIGVREE